MLLTVRQLQLTLIFSLVCAFGSQVSCSQAALVPDYPMTPVDSSIIVEKPSSVFRYLKIKHYSRRYKSPDPLLNTIYDLSQANIKPNHKANGMSVGMRLPIQ